MSGDEAASVVDPARLGSADLRRVVLDGVRDGRPATGPLGVHIDITNACNARCVTCWDHSPLLTTPRTAAWKSRSLPLATFRRIIGELDALGSVHAVVLSGMGEPLVHPDAYAMIGEVKARGWELTVISNLVAADVDQLARSGVDHLLVGVQGVTPETYAAFHPGWGEREFFGMCRALRRLTKAGIRCRHVQVINRDLAPQVVEMVRFGHLFGANRVNYKLASLAGGTQACAATPEQMRWLLAEGIPAARELAAELGVRTNLSLFERQVAAALGRALATTPIEDVGCFMGYVYTRITVALDVLYCCNTNVQVGSLHDTTFADLWRGAAWQGLRDRLRSGRYLDGCERCGKFEQNVKWSERARAHLGEQDWLAATGRAAEPVR
jgi:MoaA/NifB/PqqE/SkfB family radical SAM enzyme